ncbi:MAG: cell division protein FtsA [Ignavibacteriales bacterium]|nr:cell division protein FtsA [Ignavibacteriales bacterium]
MEPEIIVGLDIGTTKVCVVVASMDENAKFNILGVGRSLSDGLTRGVVTNIDKTVRSIQSAVSEAEARSGIKIQSVIVGIAGDHIQSFQSRGVIAISGVENEITQSDVNRLIEDTKRVALPSDRRIIHVIPQEFIIDGQDGVSDPVGMSGVRLEANVHIITGLVTAAQNIYKCVQRAGLHIGDMVLEPLASSYAVLDEEEKEVGIAMLDVGGGTTDLAVFEDRTIRYTAVIPIAGSQVTNDIRRGLGVLTEQAEKLKCQYGFAYLPGVLDDDPITIPGIGGRPPLEIDKKLLAQIIQPRMEEIFEIAAMEIKRSGYSRHLSAGVVLTGGGSLIKGAADLAREVLGLPVKIGIPGGFNAGLVREIENPIYSTCVGLVLHGLRHKEKTPLNFAEGKRSESIKKIFGKMKSWFDEL